MLKGISVSPGIAIGKAFLVPKQELNINHCTIEETHLSEEINRLYEAIQKTQSQLEEIETEASEQGSSNAAEIIDAQISILNDEEFIDEITDKIRQDLVTADNALDQIVTWYVSKFSRMSDDYLRERAADIHDTGRRILSNLLGIEPINMRILPEDSIVVAEELTPTQTAQLPKNKVIGLCVQVGGKTSHVAIIAKSLGIPALVGVESLCDNVCHGQQLVIDAQEGTVHVAPTEKELSVYRTKREEYQAYLFQLEELRPLPAETKDLLRRVKLFANIAEADEAQTAFAQGADGIGLYRTEFLYMNCAEFPSEETQYRAYRQAVEDMKGLPVTIRTLDIGGDKELPYFQFAPENNPFLGWRAIRLCLDRPDIFLPQLRAILRASHFGKVRLLYPMISSYEEVVAANAFLHQAQDQLRQEGIPFDDSMEIGAMVEIPSAAVCIDILLEELDYVCIGTNDLIQYTLAADRMNEKLAKIYQPFHPAVLRLIQHVIEMAHKAGKYASVCGEMAGSVGAVPLLLGFGLDEFSMSAGALLHVKRVIRNSSMAQVQDLARWAVMQRDAATIQRRAEEFLKALG